MNELLRALRLGTINLFGITVPGFLLLFASVTELFLPFVALALNLNGVHLRVDLEWYNAGKWILAGIFILIAYVAGFILRLTSPDELDRISVLRGKSDIWDYQSGDDRFPYNRLRSYLEERGHHDLATLVPWHPDDKQRTQRSHTVINRMKADITLYCPELATIVDSNEAHVRLMSGTWLAIRATLPMICLGTLASLAALGAPNILSRSSSMIDQSGWYYSVQTVLNAFMIIVMVWGLKRIRMQFHNRRVAELVFILHAYLRIQKHLATK
jgi:hypothetical protein